MIERIQDAWWQVTNWFWHRFLCDHCKYMRTHVRDAAKIARGKGASDG